MVESMANELSEDVMLEALLKAHSWIQEIVPQIEDGFSCQAKDWTDYSDTVAKLTEQLLKEHGSLIEKLINVLRKRNVPKCWGLFMKRLQLFLTRALCPQLLKWLVVKLKVVLCVKEC